MRLLLLYILCGVGGAPGLLVTPNTPEVALKLRIPGNADLDAAPQCDDVHLQHCQVTFNNALGINSTLDWNQPKKFQAALTYIYHMAGRHGIVQVCNAYTQFSRCLGSTYPSCINPLHFLQQGKTLTVATFYPTILKQLHFQCGGGLQTLLENWDCIAPVDIRYNSTFIACNDAYANNITNDPSHNACLYAPALLQCMSRPFVQNCNPESGWFSCEYTRVGLNYHLPYCPLVCNIGGSSKARRNAEGVQRDTSLHIGPHEDSRLPLSLNDIPSKTGFEIYRDIAKMAEEAEKSN